MSTVVSQPKLMPCCMEEACVPLQFLLKGVTNLIEFGEWKEETTPSVRLVPYHGRQAPRDVGSLLPGRKCDPSIGGGCGGEHTVS